MSKVTLGTLTRAQARRMLLGIGMPVGQVTHVLDHPSELLNAMRPALTVAASEGAIAIVAAYQRHCAARTDVDAPRRLESLFEKWLPLLAPHLNDKQLSDLHSDIVRAVDASRPTTERTFPRVTLYSVAPGTLIEVASGDIGIALESEPDIEERPIAWVTKGRTRGRVGSAPYHWTVSLRATPAELDALTSADASRPGLTEEQARAADNELHEAQEIGKSDRDQGERVLLMLGHIAHARAFLHASRGETVPAAGMTTLTNDFDARQRTTLATELRTIAAWHAGEAKTGNWHFQAMAESKLYAAADVLMRRTDPLTNRPTFAGEQRSAAVQAAVNYMTDPARGWYGPSLLQDVRFAVNKALDALDAPIASGDAWTSLVRAIATLAKNDSLVDDAITATERAGCPADVVLHLREINDAMCRRRMRGQSDITWPTAIKVAIALAPHGDVTAQAQAVMRIAGKQQGITEEAIDALHALAGAMPWHPFTPGMASEALCSFCGKTAGEHVGPAVEAMGAVLSGLGWVRDEAGLWAEGGNGCHLWNTHDAFRSVARTITQTDAKRGGQ